MNTNGNTYTVVYSTVIVVLVAAILATVAMALKPKQDANIKAETICQMLAAAQYSSMDELMEIGNENVLVKYQENIKEAYTVNLDGQKVRDLSIDPIELADNLKAQNDNMKKGKADKVELPVYVFSKEGGDITVVPVYGAGLWGPVWGYVALESDLRTIAGAYFDHSGETPGLGAKIKDDPAFRAKFSGKKVDFSAEKPFEIVKGAGKDNQVDAITGATMTSKGLSEGIAKWLVGYKAYLAAGAQDCCLKESAECCGGESCGKSGECCGDCEGGCQDGNCQENCAGQCREVEPTNVEE